MKNENAPKSIPLGATLPIGNRHAVSVSMPKWQDIIAYEEGEEELIKKLRAGYPRFVLHPVLQKLFDIAKSKHCKPNEQIYIYPSIKVAKQAMAYLQKNNASSRLQKFEPYNAYAVIADYNQVHLLKDFWQHNGNVISSRLAERILENKEVEQQKEQVAYKKIKTAICNATKASVNDIYLYPSGMAAAYEACDLLQKTTGKNKFIQYGFPYVDTLKILEKFSNEGILVISDLEKLENHLKTQEIAAIFLEFPSNPLLITPNLDEIKRLSKQYNCPIIIDDTVATWHNFNAMNYADIAWTSLTKFFSGVGDVLAGSLILNPSSGLYKQFKNTLNNQYENLLYIEDAQALASNCQDFTQRINKINKSTETICEHLQSQANNKYTLYYPKFTTPDLYKKFSKNNNGFGGLFSISFNNKLTSQKFYDNLDLAKGPSLGTNFTICCPYILLAHYHELEKVAALGIDPYLIRISIGLEEPDLIIEKLDKALKAAI